MDDVKKVFEGLVALLEKLFALIKNLVDSKDSTDVEGILDEVAGIADDAADLNYDDLK